MEEIKHSGELSGPFKNQYEAFHLRPNLFLVIILHILCLPLLPTYTQRYNVPHTCILTHAHILHWNLVQSQGNMTEISICITVIISLECQRFSSFFFSLNILFFLPGTYDMTSQCTLDLEWQYAGREGVGGGAGWSDTLIRIKVLSVTEWRALEQNHP